MKIKKSAKFVLFLLFIILLSSFSLAQEFTGDKLTETDQATTQDISNNEEAIIKINNVKEQPTTQTETASKETNDDLGSTTLVTDEAGDIVDNVFYLPFGDVISGGESER